MASSASFSVPCPKISSFLGTKQQTQPQKLSLAFPQSSKSSLSFGSSVRWSNGNQNIVLKSYAHLNEVAAEKSSNSVAVADTKPKVSLPKDDAKSEKNAIPDVAAISAFMGQVSDLVKLVDSRDITELQLKQSDCELVIRKKEALQLPQQASAVVMPQYMPPAMFQTPPPPPAAPVAATSPASPAPSAPAPAPSSPSPAKTGNSSHPVLKCPMAGTFYKCPAPGEPPFVKVGDKVQKGQVVCIIEAMKLMNEIEADQSGTITEILVEDGKPVSVDLPLFVIAP